MHGSHWKIVLLQYSAVSTGNVRTREEDDDFLWPTRIGLLVLGWGWGVMYEVGEDH